MTPRLTITTIFLLGLLTPLPVGGADWPTFRHDQRRSGVTTQAIESKELGAAWVHRAPHPPQQAWPAPARWDAYAGLRGLRNMRDYDRCFHVSVADERVYFGSSADDSVYCLDAATGAVRWSFTTDGPVRVPPTVHGGRVYFGSDDGHAYCLDAATGELVWKNGPPESARLVLNDGRFISLFPCRSGVLVQENTAYFACSMLPWEKSFLYSVDAATGLADGAGHYRRELDGLTLEGPLLTAGSVLVGPQGRVPPVLFGRTDGRPAGGFKGGGGSFVCVTPDDRLMVGPGNKTGWITESKLGDRGRVRQYASRHAVVVAGSRMLLLGDTRLSAVDRATRKPLWQVTLPLTYELIVAADTALVGCDGQVVAVALSTGKVIGQWSVAGRALGLAVANGRLFVSTDRGAVHCFHSDAPPTPPASRPAGDPAPPAPRDARPPARLASDRSLVGRWTFRQSPAGRVGLGGDWAVPRRVRDLVGGVDGNVLGTVAVRRVGAVEALSFDGQGTSVMIREDHKTAKLPTTQISAEAWVRVDQPLKWGGIVGALQDNGDYE
ncbi:MAG: PQQ-binding-like beta-propeller repeat protein, partial [Phycisphaerae bacterium]|nr:PQQ-binding-like beta-propeller repeat protein [Phycisphaerae bacterium]